MEAKKLVGKATKEDSFFTLSLAHYHSEHESITI